MIAVIVMKNKSAMKERTNSVLMPIAYGTEEMEVVITADILRRAGVLVTIAGESQIITCSRGVKIIPDVLLDDVLEEDEYDAVVLPGGSRGVENLSENPQVEKLVKANFERNALICAICAAPVLLVQFGLLINTPGVRITSHPSIESVLRQTTTAHYVADNVVSEAGIITSRGAGTAVEFALAIVETLEGRDAAIHIARDIMYSYLPAEVLKHVSSDTADSAIS